MLNYFFNHSSYKINNIESFLQYIYCFSTYLTEIIVSVGVELKFNPSSQNIFIYDLAFDT
jgi:hypothetical protein